MRIFMTHAADQGWDFFKFKYRIPTTREECSTKRGPTTGTAQLDWSGYADDIVLYILSLASLQTSLPLIDSIFKRFKLAVNSKKTETMTLKSDILKIRASCKVIFSIPTIRTDDEKASLTIFRVNKHLGELKVDTIDNTNISSKDLGKKGLHLSKSGKSKLAKNVRKKLNGEL